MLTRDLFAVADLVQSGDVMLISVNYKSITSACIFCKPCSELDANVWHKISSVSFLPAREPGAGSGVVIDPLRFLAGCRTRRLNQASSVYHMLVSMLYYCIVVY